ncbi:MAG: T9SS type A sorting domain-containing protein, partial [Flavisolibacter sp.]
YKDYQLNLSMVAPPTGDALVQYNIRAGNTASEGKDFDYTTNGNFSTPSHQQLFASGVSGSHAITIRIYDDVEVETDESFTIDFTIGGTTNAGQGNIHSFTFIIKSNEILPVTLVSNNYLIGNAAFTIGSATQGNIFDARAQRKRAQIVYKASDLTAAGMGAGKINSISFSLRKNSVRSYKNLIIGMGTTSLPYLADNGIQQVFTDLASFRSSYSTVDGLNTIPFDIPFDWDGVSNVVVEICYNNNTFDNSDFADPVICSEDDAASSSQSAVIYQTNIDCSSDFTNVFIFGSGIKPQIQFGHTNNGSVVSTALNASRTESLGPNSEVYFYSAAGVLMARIKNSSSFDYGCTQVVIDRAGTSTSPFWRNNTANNLMNKTFHVIPTNNNPSGQYDISLYFSQAEANGWQTATGASINSIQLVKAQGQIKDVSPSSPAAAGHVDVVSPAVTNFGSDYVLTYSFASGFSSFGAGIPGLSPLPVALLTFDGRLDKNASLLNWTTSWEASSRNFDLEKSADGIHFYRIANIPAAGNSNSERKYSFRDRQLNQMNYYRLRMNDIDGRSSLSQVVLVRYDQVSQNIWVVNNPFLTDLDIRFSLNASSAKMQLVSASGSVVQEKSWSHPANPLHWALPGNLSKGNYILRAEVDGEPIFIKLVKQ